MNGDDERMEEMLLRYRPAGPSAALRDRVLRAAAPMSSWRRSLWRWSAAAVLLLAAGLHWATERALRDTVTVIDTSRVEWTPAAEDAAQLLNGNGCGRAYIRLVLTVRGRHDKGPVSLTALGLSGDLR